MSIFKDVTLTFNDKNYVIRANEIMPLLAEMEDAITLGDLHNKKRVPLVRVSQAYGIALRYVGVDVTDETIYRSIFGKAKAATIISAVRALLSMMIPPDALQNTVAPASTFTAKKPKRKNKK